MVRELPEREPRRAYQAHTRGQVPEWRRPALLGGGLLFDDDALNNLALGLFSDLDASVAALPALASR